MISRLSSPALFARLRRDSALFALVSALVLMLHALQPLAMAEAAAHGIDDVICAPSGAGNQGSPGMPLDDECRQCVAGPCAGFATAAPDLDAADISFPPALHEGVRANETAVLSPRRPGDPPPATRAPPLSA